MFPDSSVLECSESLPFTPPFWFLRNYPLQIKRLPGPVTERGGNQRPPSMAINTTTTLDSFGLLDPPFLFYRTLKISLAEKYQDSREKKRLDGKTFRIQKFSDSKLPL